MSNKPFVLDMPPKGGFQFTRVARNIPRKGVHGITIWASIIGLSLWALDKKMDVNQQESVLRKRRIVERSLQIEELKKQFAFDDPDFRALWAKEELRDLSQRKEFRGEWKFNYHDDFDTLGRPQKVAMAFINKRDADAKL